MVAILSSDRERRLAVGCAQLGVCTRFDELLAELQMVVFRGQHEGCGTALVLCVHVGTAVDEHFADCDITDDGCIHERREAVFIDGIDRHFHVALC